MREEERGKIDKAQRALLLELDGWSKCKTSTYAIEERAVVADKLCKLSDSLVKTSERLSAMYGLDAPKPAPGSTTTVTNNTLFLTGMLDDIKAKRALAEPVQLADCNGNAGH
jgi:hypothetical protein